MTPVSMSVTPALTNPMHMEPPAGSASKSWQTKAAPDSETKMDGNQVVLEEQMIKMSEARQNYDAGIGFYEKSSTCSRPRSARLERANRSKGQRGKDHEAWPTAPPTPSRP